MGQREDVSVEFSFQAEPLIEKLVEASVTAI
jgi:hypothetical protein